MLLYTDDEANSGRDEQVAPNRRDGITNRDVSFEGLRGLAALSVIFSHFLGIFYPYLGHWDRPDAGLQPTHGLDTILDFPPLRLFYSGSFAVSIFFVLSGYVLTKKYFETSDVKVLQVASVKRYPRLMLPVLASALFVWALVALGAMQNQRAPEIRGAGWPMGMYVEHISFWDAIWQGSVMAPLFGHPEINEPVWSIMYEVRGSFGLFFVFALFYKRSIFIAFIAFLGFCETMYTSNSTILYYLAMFAGSLLNIFRSKIAGHPIIGGLMIVIGAYLGLFCMNRPWYGLLIDIPMPHRLPFPMWDMSDHGAETLLFETIGSIMLVYGVAICGPAMAFLSSRIPVYLGKISFSSYLLHWPIICSFTYWCMALIEIKLGVEFQLATFITYMLSLVVIILVSDLFERLIDRPATRISGLLARYVWAPRSGAPQVRDVPLGAVSSAE